MKTIAYITYILTIISTFTYAGKDMRIYLSDPAEIDFLIEDLQKLKATNVIYKQTPNTTSPQQTEPS